MGERKITSFDPKVIHSGKSVWSDIPKSSSSLEPIEKRERKKFSQKESINKKISRLKNESNGNKDTNQTYVLVSESNMEETMKPVVERVVRKEIEEYMKGEKSKMKEENKVNTGFMVYYSFASALIAVFAILLILNVIPMIPGSAGLIFSAVLFQSVNKGRKNWKLIDDEPTI